MPGEKWSQRGERLLYIVNHKEFKKQTEGKNNQKKNSMLIS